MAELASLITGFEMIAFLQFNFDSTVIGQGLQICYAITSALTVRPVLPADSSLSCQCICVSLLVVAEPVFHRSQRP